VVKIKKKQIKKLKFSNISIASSQNPHRLLRVLCDIDFFFFYSV